jgi:prevent-host-death family protein
MEEVTISELRTHCSAILRRVYETRRPVSVTRRGKVIGQIAPVPFELLGEDADASKEESEIGD